MRLLIVGLALTVLGALCGCKNTKEHTVENALEFAGQNRHELEKVLEHYAGDSLKLAAARFLISNMIDQYGYDSPILDSIEAELKPLQYKKMNFLLSEDRRDYWRNFDFASLPKVYDCQTITADYLIRNIDQAFLEWTTRPWNRNLKFNDFCELLLPYRIGDERLTDWRLPYMREYTAALDSVYSGDNPVEAAAALVNIIKERPEWFTNYDVPGPHRDALALLNCRMGNGMDKCDRLTYAMRACGIPVTADLNHGTPPYTYTNQHREWCVVLNPKTGRYHRFGYNDAPSDKALLDDGSQKGMVYRRSFTDPYGLDVSDQYYGKSEIEVPISGNPDEVYLGTFYNGKWNAVGKGEKNGKNAVFRNIQRGVFYAPLCKVDGELTPCGNAFTNDDGHTRILKPDTTKMEKIEISRLSDMHQRIKTFRGDHMGGAKVWASTTPNFANADLLAEIPEEGVKYFYNRFVTPGLNKHYNYIRYELPKGKHVHLAEFFAYADTLSSRPIKMSIHSDIAPEFKPECMIDYNTQWVFTADNGVNTIDLKLDKPSPIGSLVIVPASDTYDIWPGKQYEVLYFDGANGWKPIDVVRAKKETIAFEVPSDALLWVKEYQHAPSGKAFYHENGTQKWTID